MKTIAMRTALVSVQLAAVLALAGCLSGGETDEPASEPAPAPQGSSNRAPTISGNPSSSVNMGNQYTFTPTASDPDNDPLTFDVRNAPAWMNFSSSNGALNGTPTMANIGTYPGIVVSVSDGQLSSSLPQFTVTVVQNSNGSITLTWTAPTQNEDGTPLNDLAAYKFYYGTSPGNYSNQVQVDSPGITSYVLENLTPSTSYYIVAAAVNGSGVESRLSNEATGQAL